MGKQGASFSHVSLHRLPSLNLALLAAIGVKSRSWSMNCPHCISMCVCVVSSVMLVTEASTVDTRRALGLG